MTAINTNTAALNAQYYLAKSNKEMESSMAKLSSGQKVNSAADDAAGLAIASRMTSQIKGLAMAVKNSNDSMSLAQTAEGAMEEVTNMLQRIRELAVQSANGTMNDSDRASLDAEVQALKTEIDRVANTTTFNSQKLLDGSYKSTFQIGDKGGQTVGLSIASVATNALGMGDGASSSKSIVSTRVDLDSNGTLKNAIDAGDVVINGQALGAFAATDDMEAIVTNINNNVDNVTASAFNVVVAKNIGDGVTGGAATTGLTLMTREMGATADTTFVISASSSMTELVNNINNETGGVIKAEVNTDGKLVLSNTTGAFISVEDDSSSVGSGFADHSTAVQHNGFLKLESDDGSNIRIERGNSALVAPGKLSDLHAFGLNETINTTQADGYTVVGEALKSNVTHFGVVETTQGKTGTNEVQTIVGLDAAALTAMAGHTFSVTDNAGNTVTTAALDSSVTLAEIKAALDTAITAFDTAAGNANPKTSDFLAAVTVGTDSLTLTYSVDSSATSQGDSTAQNVNMAKAFATAPTSTSGLETGYSKGDLTINGVEIFNEDIASTSFGGKLNLINSFTAETGVTASATFDQTFAIDPNKIFKGDVISFNGTEIEVTASSDVAALVTAINARTDATGLTASRSGNNITLKGENVQALTIEQLSAAEMTNRLVSAINDATTTAADTRTVAINASDIHAGREYTFSVSGGSAAAMSVDITAASDETAATFAKKIEDALQAAHTSYELLTDITLAGSTVTFTAAATAGDSTIKLEVKSIGDTFGTTNGVPVTSYGSIKLDSVSNNPIKIDLGEVTTSANHKRLHGFLEANVGAADYDVNAPQLSAGGGTSMAGLSVTTAAQATAALATLDKAIDAVNANRGNLGALQNRLEYTINNLSSISNATSGAKGRILDADFAKETSELTKNQILTQAATSMLAQANQSKQGILALLQG